MRRFFVWFAVRFSLARLMLLLVLAGLVAATCIHIASQRIPDKYRLQPPPVDSLRPQVPERYK